MSSRQPRPGAWALVGATVLPIVAMMIYLAVDLAAPERGIRFSPKPGLISSAYFAVLWLCALTILCGVRGMCL